MTGDFVLITDDFVLLNFPKTGSSFTREAIKRVYEQSDSRVMMTLEKFGIVKPRVMELMFPKIDEIHHAGIHDQHGTWRQIPPQFLDRQVISITREPISRYHSAYRFGWWKHSPPGDPDEIRKQYPNFPDLSFTQYFEMASGFAVRDRLKGITPKIQLGLHSIQFIQFYFRDPDKTLRIIDDEYIDQKKYLEDMADVHFMEQTNLRHALKSYLLGIGRTAAELNFLDVMKELNTTAQSSKAECCNEPALDKDLIENVLSRDRLIYKMFPHYHPGPSLTTTSPGNH